LVGAAIVENNVGYTVTVGIERSSPRRLQTLPLIKSQDAGLAKRYINQSINHSAVVVELLQGETVSI